MKCFVASAFGYNDVDALFDKTIRPVLLKNGVEALRVDRVEHNDDIDDKILALMKEADLCVADLTYARPSVYYEAGFMRGAGKPVIFTARNDHFRQVDNDPLGNLAVHFDLKMKNIVAWRDSDKTFEAKLDSRIRHVLAPLVKIAQAERNDAAERVAFGKRALTEQLQTLRSAATELLRQNKFTPEGEEIDNTRYYRSEGAKRTITVDVIVKRAFHKDDRYFLNHTNVRSLARQYEKKEARKKELTTIIVCVSPLPISRPPFRAYFSSYAENDAGALFREHPPRLSDYNAMPKNFVTIEFLDRIGSESEFREKFRALLKRIK